MSDQAATIEPTAAPEANAQDMGFVDSFQAFLKGATSSAPEPAPAPEPEPAPAPEPKAKAEPKPKAEPKVPVKELAATRDDIDPDLHLPIDDADDGESDDGDSSDDNPYDKGSPQHRRFEAFRKETAALKGSLDTERQARTQAESRLKEVEAAAARAEELEKRIASYEAKIAVTNLTESEAYQKTIAKPLQSIIERSDTIADRYGIDPDALADTLEIADANARRAKLKELTSGLDVDPDDHYELRKLADEVQPLKAKRAELLANADKALTELEAEKAQAAQEAALAAAEARKAAVAKVAEKVASQVPFLKSVEGLNYDEVVAATRDTDFDALNAPVKAYNHLAGLILPKLLRERTSLTKQIESLSDDLSLYKKQSPRVSPGNASPDKADEDEGLVESFKKRFGGR